MTNPDVSPQKKKFEEKAPKKRSKLPKPDKLQQHLRKQITENKEKVKPFPKTHRVKVHNAKALGSRPYLPKDVWLYWTKILTTSKLAREGKLYPGLHRLLVTCCIIADKLERKVLHAFVSKVRRWVTTYRKTEREIRSGRPPDYYQDAIFGVKNRPKWRGLNQQFLVKLIGKTFPINL